MRRFVELSGMIEEGLWGYHELPGLENIVPRVVVETVATVIPYSGKGKEPR
jgi:hypothetical protein